MDTGVTSGQHCLSLGFQGHSVTGHGVPASRLPVGQYVLVDVSVYLHGLLIVSGGPCAMSLCAR